MFVSRRRDVLELLHLATILDGGWEQLTTFRMASRPVLPWPR